MSLPAPPHLSRPAAPTLGIVVLTTLIAGTLDLLGAFVVHGYLVGNTPPGRILQSIARGVFGNASFSRGASTAYWGLFLHYVITLLFTVFYFAWCPYIPFLLKRKVAAGFLYGLFVWTIMNFLVLPFSRAGAAAFTLQSVGWGLALVIAFIGMPIAMIAHRFWKR